MEFPPASDIKKLRKSLDITQARLAKESGISQSTIAKIESGKISASYETVVRLFETLESIGSIQVSDLKAIDVANRNVVFAESTSRIHEASDQMVRTGYSQLPVLDNGVPVGSISERRIFELLREGITMNRLSGMEVSQVMGEVYPVVPDNTPISAVAGLMVDSNAVLVSSKGTIVGMITKADLLKLV